MTSIVVVDETGSMHLAIGVIKRYTENAGCISGPKSARIGNQKLRE